MKTTVPMSLASLQPDQHLSCEMTSQEFIIKEPHLRQNSFITQVLDVFWGLTGSQTSIKE